MNVAADTKDQNIRVVIRVRPLNESETTRNHRTCIRCIEDQQSIKVLLNQTTSRTWRFDRTFDENTAQQSIFDQCGAKELALQAINGYATTIFAFGQTGSGKTFTITGPEKEIHPMDSGIIPRALKFLFENLPKGGNVKKVSVKVAYLEIYNEQVHDLLNSTSNALSVRWTAERGFYVENLLVIECESLDDCISILEEGLRNRTTRSHKMNEYSSRSHSIMTVYLETELVENEETVVTQGKLSFVDLAGSEKVKESMTSGEVFAEALNINKSLLTLGNCISALSDARKRGGHVPYRDSKLTKLLADSLGGTGMALMFACVAPSVANIHETLKTLRYANRAKHIRNRPTVHVDSKEELVRQLRRDLKAARAENESLRAALAPESVYGVISSRPDDLILSPAWINPNYREKGLQQTFQSIPQPFHVIPPPPSTLPPIQTHQAAPWFKHPSGLNVSEDEHIPARGNFIPTGSVMASQMQTIQRPVSQLSAYYHSEPGGFPIYPLQALEYPSHSFLSRSRNETASEFGTRNPPQFLRDRSTRTQIVASKQPPFSRSLHRAGGETISNGQPRRVDTKVYFKKVATHATETDKSEGKQRTSDKGTISEATAQSSVNKMRSENSTSSYLVSDDQSPNRNPRTDCEQQQPSEQVVPTPPRLKPTSAETVSRIPRFGRRKPEGQSLLSTSVQIPPRYVATAPSQRSVSPRMRRETIASLQHDQIVISTKKTNRQRQRMIAEQASSKGSRDRQLPRYPKLDTQSPTVARIYPSQSRHGAPPTFIKSPYPPIELNGAQSQHLPLASLNEVQQMKDMLLRDLHQLDHAIHQISR